MWRICLPLLLLASLQCESLGIEHYSLRQNETVCFESGRCIGLLVDFDERVADEQDCANRCLWYGDDCRHFSYGASTDVCNFYENCENTTDVSGWVFGEAACGEYACFAEATKCVGYQVGDQVHAEDALECHRQCQDNADCQWFTFDSASSLNCLLTSNCRPRACSTCQMGHVSCRTDEKLMLIGGVDNSHKVLRAVEVVDADNAHCNLTAYPFDVSGAVARTTGRGASARAEVCGGITGGGDVLANCYAFNSTTKKWDNLASMHEGRVWAAAAKRLGDKEWWISGGMDEDDSLKDKIEVLINGLFSYAFDLPLAMAHHCLVNIDDNVLFVAGGLTNTGVSRSAYQIDLESGFWWEEVADMDHVRFAHTCNVIGNEVYVVGGSDGDDVLTSVEVFNVATRSWRAGPPLPERLHQAASVTEAEAGGFLVAGGLGNTASKNVYRFDGEWTLWGAQLLQAKHSIAAAFVPYSIC